VFRVVYLCKLMLAEVSACLVIFSRAHFTSQIITPQDGGAQFNSWQLNNFSN
jgi:hypothetical protein